MFQQKNITNVTSQIRIHVNSLHTQQITTYNSNVALPTRPLSSILSLYSFVWLQVTLYYILVFTVMLVCSVFNLKKFTRDDFTDLNSLPLSSEPFLM